MITIIFGAITNNTNSTALFYGYEYKKGSPAQKKLIATIESGQTRTSDTPIVLNPVDKLIATGSFIAQRASDEGIELLLNIAWGQGLFIDMTAQNHISEHSIDLPTVVKKVTATKNSCAIIDLILAGDQFEQSKIIQVQRT